MKSRERVISTLNGRAYDRVPVGPFIGHRAASELGLSLKDYYTDGNNIAEAQYEMKRKIGHDIMVSAADTYYISEAFGMETVHHTNALPTIKQLLFRELKDSRNLSVPNPESDGRMPVYLQAVEKMRSLAGDEAAVRGTGTGPFSLAAYMFGEAQFLMILADIEYGLGNKENEKHYRNLMEITSDTTIAFLKAQIIRGADIIYMGDSFASSDMISPEFYRKYVFEYHKKVFDMINPICREYGAFSMLHICGDNRAVFPNFAETGVDMIEIDHKVPLVEARNLLGSDICLIGNLDPTAVLLQGEREAVFSASMSALETMHAGDGKYSKFILGSGCFVALNTPTENLKAMVMASEQFQKNYHG